MHPLLKRHSSSSTTRPQSTLTPSLRRRPATPASLRRRPATPASLRRRPATPASPSWPAALWHNHNPPPPYTPLAPPVPLHARSLGSGRSLLRRLPSFPSCLPATRWQYSALRPMRSPGRRPPRSRLASGLGLHRVLGPPLKPRRLGSEEVRKKNERVFLLLSALEARARLLAAPDGPPLHPVLGARD